MWTGLIWSQKEKTLRDSSSDFMFEILKGDLAARIGILHTNHGPVQTPAFVPVVHPVSQSIAPQKLKKMGFELVITNAYITLNRYGE
jgi:7-cyano-7-deazaguanine tRNA-ribosyltransferase